MNIKRLIDQIKPINIKNKGFILCDFLPRKISHDENNLETFLSNNSSGFNIKYSYFLNDLAISQTHFMMDSFLRSNNKDDSYTTCKSIVILLLKGYEILFKLEQFEKEFLYNLILVNFVFFFLDYLQDSEDLKKTCLLFEQVYLDSSFIF